MLFFAAMTDGNSGRKERGADTDCKCTLIWDKETLEPVKIFAILDGKANSIIFSFFAD